MRSFETWSDAQLLAGTAQDPAAFGAWYRRHEREVLAFFRFATRSSELAADLTAETFAAALESIGGYRRELGEPRAWLFGIARHVLARSLARGRVENRARAALALPVLALDDEAIERIEAISANGPIAALLDALPPDVRAAVEGRVVDEREYPELAERLECSESVVRKRVSRGLARMRKRIEEGQTR
jgi:RNA polymerase sigma-70 factor (ECF subfamily)